MKPKVIAIVGPTAVGKTALSIEVAKQCNGEVISGDSMQVYRGMDIGTAKVTKEEMDGIPHYMIDIMDPHASFSVAEFQTQVKDYIHMIHQKGKVPIIVGGTGLYIQSILFDYHFSQQGKDQNYREKMEQQMKEQGVGPFYQRLQQVDPEQADKIHPHNMQRVIRALEVYDQTGKTMTEYQKEQSDASSYDFYIVGLEMERSALYQRINQRVDQMIDDGLVEEARYFHELGLDDSQAMKAIGYKEFLPYFNGTIPLPEAIEQLKRNSRRFAKRQFTWFKNKMPVHWYTMEVSQKKDIFENILTDLEGFLKET
ncbi:tRNA (adenosine(37)-N6)-dimethylallyltransferase MiaA [Gracilibacillus halophilus]|nr:tRNA (adenosine(37)-N6)-dimethylallyltransferase MiaA [Gracilibacillus halophilus]